MARLILIGILKIEPELMTDDDKKAANKYLNSFKTLNPGNDDSLKAKFIRPTDVDGGNGGGGDSSGIQLDFRISDSEKTAQRWVFSPKPGEGQPSGKAFNEIKFPRLTKAEVCLIFDSRTEYETHMLEYSRVYNRLFVYVTTIVETMKI